MERIRVKLKSFDSEIVDKSAQEIVKVMKRIGARFSGPIPLPTKRRIYTVLRSPHVNKNSREQFVLEVHKRLIDIYEPNPDVIDALTKMELPPGVDVELKQK